MLYRQIAHGGMLWDGGEPTGGDESQADGKYNPTTLDDAQKIIEALVKRVAERDAKRTEAQARATDLEARLKALEDAQRQALEETGNHAELAKRYQTELEALKPRATRAEALEAVIRDSNEARLATIPEDVRGLVPTDYPPEKLQAWLNANASILTKPLAPRLDGGAGGSREASGEVVRLTDEQRRIARSMGISDDEMIEQIKSQK